MAVCNTDSTTKPSLSVVSQNKEDDIDASWTFGEDSKKDVSDNANTIGEEWSVIERSSSTNNSTPPPRPTDHPHNTTASPDPVNSQDAASSASKKSRGIGGWLSSAKNRTIGLLYNFYRAPPGLPPKFSESPIWMLGNSYECIHTDSPCYPHGDHYCHPGFLEDFRSMLWFSYRRDFPPLTPSSLTADTGWGCMLRTGQMMLARVLMCQQIANRVKSPPGRPIHVGYYAEDGASFRKLFADFPLPQCPFSVHNIILRHTQMKQQAGTSVNDQVVAEWYAPANTATVLKHLVHKHNPTNIAMYVPRESVIYVDQVTSICASGFFHHSPQCPRQKMAAPPSKHISFLLVPQDATEIENSMSVSVPASTYSLQAPQKSPFWRPVFILVPLRLGLDRINDEYVEGLKVLLKCPQTVGIIGGRPKQSLYFVGYQDDQFIYMDPHIVQPAPTDPDLMEEESYSPYVPQVINIREIDPSLAVGFYCHTHADFILLCTALTSLAQSSGDVTIPVTVAEQHPDYLDECDPDFDSSCPECGESTV